MSRSDQLTRAFKNRLARAMSELFKGRVPTVSVNTKPSREFKAPPLHGLWCPLCARWVFVGGDEHHRTAYIHRFNAVHCRLVSCDADGHLHEFPCPEVLT